ncbi:MAG: hypothetical protein M3R25_00980 [Bacteroidota bacterium]|nr:hypothetical protein [Bacteroidota bacterium]
MTKFSFLLICSCFWFSIIQVHSQGLSDLYLFSISELIAERHLHTPKFISAFNPRGYTNQPWFTPMGDLLVSVRKHGDIQTDIYQLSLSTRKYTQLTKTPESEYSPRLDPSEDYLTFLRQVSSEPIDQQIFKVNLKTKQLDHVTLNLKDIGYYTWISTTELGLLRIDDLGHKLTYYSTESHNHRRVTSSIGRTLLSDKDGSIIYIHKYDKDFWYIKKYHPSTSTIDIVINTIGQNEDFALGPDGTYYMGNKHSIYYFRPGLDKEWKLMEDLLPYGISNISRITINPNGKQLVLVSSKESS